MTAKLIRFPEGKPKLVSDPDLAAKAAAGERAAFSELVRRHQVVVRGMMRRLTKGHQADADDLAQATFLRAWQQIGTYAGRTFRSWLCTIAYREFLQARRKSTAEIRLTDAVTVLADHVAQPSPIGVKYDLDLALATLPDTQRILVVLCTGAGLSHTEASMVTGWPLGTVKSNLARGKQALRARLADYGAA